MTSLAGNLAFCEWQQVSAIMSERVGADVAKLHDVTESLVEYLLLAGRGLIVENDEIPDTLSNFPEEEFIGEATQSFFENVLPEDIISKLNEVEKNNENAAGPSNAPESGYWEEEFEDNLSSPILRELFVSPKSQTGRGRNEQDSANDYWSSSIPFEGSIDIQDAVFLVERSRRRNQTYNAEQVDYFALLDVDKIPTYARRADLKTVVAAARQLFQTMFTKATANLEPQDLIRLVLMSEVLDRPISTCLMRVSDMSVESFLGRVLHVLQSKEEVKLDEGPVRRRSESSV
ncbi:hypothetical protein AVEN_80858-1 [Araneus ventricosus]|uniref:Uncharacterized protein n=1 Tax=Araneus ventricosus TaxID=182803 RepID=A0A4Y2JJE7_ARAVE|nr:hypothetical protein AVEN_80858-1 [Araneus ventricosus]